MIFQGDKKGSSKGVKRTPTSATRKEESVTLV
jgi:hypothetical protein